MTVLTGQLVVIRARGHLYSLCLQALPKQSLGYTALTGVPPKVQPMLVSFT